MNRTIQNDMGPGWWSKGEASLVSIEAPESWFRLLFALRQQQGDCTGDGVRQGAISTAGEDDRHSRAQDDTCALRIGQVIQLLDQHIASFQIGHDQDVGLTSDL